MRATVFSAKAEYACIAMVELALRHGDPQPVRLKAIAEAHNIPQRFLVQILLQLKGAGLVVSARGAAGGYLLARPPDQITVADVVGVIDRVEPAESDAARKPRIDSLPSTPPVRAVRAVWREIVAAQQRILDDTSLADLARRSQDNYALSYQI
jgi:Rrf2 family transcriptional regulator, cysteine metabolism repressor